VPTLIRQLLRSGRQHGSAFMLIGTQFVLNYEQTPGNTVTHENRNRMTGKHRRLLFTV
jgi:hypothetical protein